MDDKTKVLKAKITQKFGFQKEFAKKLGISDATLSTAISGKRQLTAEEANEWHALLGGEKSDYYTQTDTLPEPKNNFIFKTTKIANTIIETTDYGLFDLYEYNRDVRRTKELTKSMQRHGWIDGKPMHVVQNGKDKLLIKDGHHRFKVAKKLKLPVKYVLSDDVATVHELAKTTVTWTLEDYLSSYVRAKLPEYVKLEEYYNETKIPLSACIYLLGNPSASPIINNGVKGITATKFKNGDFKVVDGNNAQVVADLVTHMRNQKIEWGTYSLLVQALIRLLKLDYFDPERLKHKVATFPGLMKKQPDMECCLRMLETIYNYQSHDKVPLAFPAMQGKMKH